MSDDDMRSESLRTIMSELLFVVSLALLILGVIGSVLPLLPGALSSLVGVYLYWWSTGFTAPGTVALFVLTVIGVSALVIDYFGGALAARFGGASLLTSTLAAIVGFVLLFVTGPLGLLLGMAATVFIVEYIRHRDARASLKATVSASVGLLTSAVAQLLLTVSMLLIVLITIF